MSVFKIPCGISQQPKIAVAAKKSGLRRGEVLAVWIALMDCASQGIPPGRIESLECDDIAAVLDFETADVACVLRAFTDRGVLAADGSLPEWSAIQRLSSVNRARQWRRQSGQRERRAAATPPPPPSPPTGSADPDAPDEAAARRARLRAQAARRRGR